jgi:L-ascorbate metabolism protein UlaG (beta-lactamase superfamily)
MTSATAFAERLSAWRPPRDTVGIVALGQAGFALRRGDDLVLIDPFLSPRPSRLVDAVADPDALRGVRAVLATHEHEDHLDLPAWTILAERSPDARFVVPEPLVPLVTGVGIARDRVTAGRIGTPIELGAARATPVPACHAVEMAEGYSLGDQDHRVPRFVGYVVELGGVRLYHAGDSLSDDRIVRAVAELHPDIALLPINGRDAEREGRGIVGNMSPDEAAQLARDVGVALAIPMHFDTIRGNTGEPDAFVRAIRRHHPRASVWVPVHGSAFVWPGGPGAWPAGRS